MFAHPGDVMPLLTLCVVTRDEESLLAAGLASVGAGVERLVLDLGSRDKTVEVAERVGARVVRLPYETTVGQAKNRAFDEAQGEFLLFLSASERLNDAERLVEALRTADWDVARLPIVDVSGPGAALPELSEAVWSVRLCRRTSDLRWKGEFDEPEAPLELADVEVAVISMDEPTLQEVHRLRRMDRWAAAVAADPENPLVRMELARSMLRCDREDEARAQIDLAWEQSAHATPGVRRRVSVARAEHLAKRGEWAQILADLGSSWEVDVAAAVWAARAELALYGQKIDSTRLATAEARLERAGQLLRPHGGQVGATPASIAYLQGLVALHRGDFAKAEERFGRAVPERASKLGKVEAQIGLGRVQEALVALQSLFTADCPDAWLLAAIASDVAGISEEREVFLRRATEIGEAALAPHRRRRWRAMNVLGSDSLGLAKIPGVFGPLLSGTANQDIERGEQAFGTGDLAEAIRCFVRALRRDSDHVVAWNDLAVALHAVGRSGGAALALDMALRLDSDHADARTNLTSILAERGHPELAAPVARGLADGSALLRGLGVFGAAGSADETLLSVLVDPSAEGTQLVNLLDQLALQDLSPGRFEVILVGDAPTESRPFHIQTVPSAQKGRAADWNRAIAAARGRFLVFHSGDARPDRSNLQQHLSAQLASATPTAILGSREFLPEHREHPFTELMQRSLLFTEAGKLQAGQAGDWRNFEAGNLSVPKEVVQAVGGFDEAFGEATGEDHELGVRLFKRFAVSVVYRPEIHTWLDRRVTLESFMHRQLLLGMGRVKLYAKHSDLPRNPEEPQPTWDVHQWMALRSLVDNMAGPVRNLVHEVREIERRGLPAAPGSEARKQAFQRMHDAVFAIGSCELRRGMSAGHSQLRTSQLNKTASRLQERMMSLVIPNLNGFPHVVGALESFRRTNRGPYQLVIVDNGSTDGSLEWLRTQPDVTLLEMGRNLGAPTARNRGLAVVEGDLVMFSDNDVIFTPRWRELLCAHLDLWPDVGIVGPVSDYVVEVQKAKPLPADDEDLDSWASEYAAKHRGSGVYIPQLILFAMLCRREVIEKIGGIDEDYNPWGFEDNDYCARAKIAGFELRIAQDCFIKHLGSRTSKTANIDYGQLLYRNWEVFKRKWEIDPATPYGRIDLRGPLKIAFDPKRHFVPFR